MARRPRLLRVHPVPRLLTTYIAPSYPACLAASTGREAAVLRAPVAIALGFWFRGLPAGQPFVVPQACESIRGRGLVLGQRPFRALLQMVSLGVGHCFLRL